MGFFHTELLPHVCWNISLLTHPLRTSHMNHCTKRWRHTGHVYGFFILSVNSLLSLFLHCIIVASLQKLFSNMSTIVLDDCRAIVVRMFRNWSKGRSHLYEAKHVLRHCYHTWAVQQSSTLHILVYACVFWPPALSSRYLPQFLTA